MKIDTLGFVAPPGAPMEVDPNLNEHVDFLHVTATPPIAKNSKSILSGFGPFPSLAAVREKFESQSNVYIVEASKNMKEDSSSTGIILGLQETPHDVNKSVLQEFYETGIRVITPSYQQADHPLGSGYASSEKRLTDVGRQFLLDAAETGLIIDLSHLGHQTARDVMDFRDQQGIDLPVFASHGGVYELFDGDRNHINNLRNLPWDVLERVAEAGGLVGVYALTFGLSETDNTPEAFFNQTTKAVRRLGCTAVSIGTDAVYQKRDVYQWAAQVEKLSKMLVKSGELEPRFPDIPLELNKVDRLAYIGEALVAHGLTGEETESVVGKNAFQFFKANL